MVLPVKLAFYTALRIYSAYCIHFCKRLSRKELFIKGLSELPSIEDKEDELTIGSKFNFSYFDSSQEAGQDFSDWTNSQLCELLNKLKSYSKMSLDYWRNERAGKGGLKVFATYCAFPRKSSFNHPKHVPHQAQWWRFRLGSKIRLIGFTLPAELHNTFHHRGEFFDKNTFYVVFLDRDHKFYLTEEE